MQPLKTVLGAHGQVAGVRALGQAEIAPGARLEFVDVKRMPDAYRDMARSQPYDICEMAPIMYLMALQRGARLTALPLPMTRRFRHGGVKKRKGLDIAGPKGLEGRRVGVRNYSVTAAVWTRGIYADDYGLDPARVTWVTEEAENLDDLRLPANARRLPEGRSLVQALEAGEIDAAFEGLAGADSARVELEDLVDDVDAAERRWFQRTGIYPIHGLVVVKNEVLARHPQLAPALFELFSQAKRDYLQRLDQITEPNADDRRYRKLRAWVGDPLPYGLEANLASLQALVRYAHQQGLIARAVDVHNIVITPGHAAAGGVAHWD